MKYSWLSAVCLFAGSVSALPIVANSQVTPSPTVPGLAKRAVNNGAQSVWTSTHANGVKELVTATTIDGVTISASPAKKTDNSKPTPWISLDGSGIPIMVTPTIVKAGGETISASPVAPTNYPTPSSIPPVLRCFGNRVPQSNQGSSSIAPGYPFCSPLNGTEWIVGETYWITWDPTYWGGSDITQVKIFARFLPIDDDQDRVFETDWVSNTDGYFPLNVLSDYRIRNTDGYMFINMRPLVSVGSDADHTGTVSGPIIRVISSKSEAETVISRLPSDNRKNSISNGSSSGLSGGKLAAAIVVPLVFVVIVCSLGYYWFVLRRRAINRANIEKATTGKGNAIPKGQSLTTVSTNQSQMTTSNPFHDAHAVELADGRPATKPSSAI
ncbi:hypothetical protein DV451_001916 [Geotrichum candidum]|uniref:Mid2 domain-containing protein n=1 Tax=Geotrichum candidum TaxID=1173061 RepID=A0A9P5KUM3_GEOCN|nr:hypothetical protein DV451_001916 [Geotrichum candidum]